MPYIDKNAILQSLTKEDVIKIVGSLDQQDYKTGSNGELIFNTSICHGGDSWKLYYYHEANGNYPAKVFHCYTCGDTFSIVELVIRAHRNKGITVTFYKALRYIANVVGKVDDFVAASGESQKIDTWDWLAPFTSKKGTGAIPTLSEYSETYLECFCYYPHEAWLEDNISSEVMSEFEIGYYPKDDSITIPHRDSNGRLIGVRERHLSPEDIRNYGKYTPVTVQGVTLKHQLGSTLYGLWVNKNRIKSCGKVLLVESEKSVLQVNSYFGDNSYALAVCGSNITDTQKKILLEELGVSEVILAFDREYEDPHSYAAEAYKNKLIKKVASLVPFCKVTMLLDDKERLDLKDSPTDKGKDILLELLDEKMIVDSAAVADAASERFNE